MEITVTQAQGQVPVTILKPHGALDASTYRELMAEAQKVYQAGARRLLVDLSAVDHMSSSGIVALHTIATLMRGESLPDEESGWESARAIDRDQDKGIQANFKLLSPNPNVDRVLNMVGFKRFLEVHTDQETAVASFTP